MTYEREVQEFAREYSEVHSQRDLAERLGIPTTTLHNGLARAGGFAPRTHSKVVQGLEDIAGNLHAQGLPLHLGGLPIPLRRPFIDGLKGRDAEAPTDGAEVSEEDVPGDCASGADNSQIEAEDGVKVCEQEDSISSDGSPIMVPDGVSVLDSSLWKDGPPMNTALFYEPELVEKDLRRLFEVYRREGHTDVHDGDEVLRGWKGRHLAGGIDDEGTVRLIEEWSEYEMALRKIREAGCVTTERAYLHCSHEILSRQLILVHDYNMTPPERDFEFDDFERHEEIERLRTEIRNVSDSLRALDGAPSGGITGWFTRFNAWVNQEPKDRKEQ